MERKREPKKSQERKRRPAKARKGAASGAAKRIDVETAVRWYEEKRPLYKSLAGKVAGIIEEVLDADGVEYHSVDKRAKKVESYKKKAGGYEDPTSEIHDMSGVRIIAYVESEANRIADVVRGLFDVDPGLSEDKSVNLGVDKVGYRSDHYVATLPRARCRLAEFKRFAGMEFEIQVRTILQHAWAEIEHDRNYKFAGVLPSDIQRRFALLAGSLELLDREFDRIAAEIDSYAGSVIEKTSAGELHIPIDTISLRQYLQERFASLVESGQLSPFFGEGDQLSASVVEELRHFDVSTLAEFDRLIPDGFDDAAFRSYSVDDPHTLAVLVRNVLVIADADKYFAKSWPSSRWKILSDASVRFLAAFGFDVQKLSREYGIRIGDPK
jgi:ppGpp synthetase/RelA/SpoT-type nucleotidyltranferase